MPVVRASRCAVLLCALLVVGCRGPSSNCPRGNIVADPPEIPDGASETTLSVEVINRAPIAGLEVVTEFTAESGTIEDPFAQETTYACAFDVSGPVEICVETTYSEGDLESGLLDAAEFDEKLRGPNVYLSNPQECSTRNCIEVICPEVKNICPDVSSLVIDPDMLEAGETATITVDAEDPDDNPEPLTTTLTARHGTIADPHALETTYTCDPEVGGVVAICVDASDGACTETLCESVLCPGEPLDNTCPIIQGMSADPNPIPPPDDRTTISVDAIDPDDFPEPLTIEWSSEGGGFEDRTSPTTTFRCTEPGPVEVCVEARDGDESCAADASTRRCMTIECPSDVRPNICPNLNVINPIPRLIESPNTSTNVETRGVDTDEKPFPLVLTLSALWGSFENTENLQCTIPTPDCGLSPNVVFQDAIYNCDRPGDVELCVTATDGACTKTLCTNVICPDDIPPP